MISMGATISNQWMAKPKKKNQPKSIIKSYHRSNTIWIGWNFWTGFHGAPYTPTSVIPLILINMNCVCIANAGARARVQTSCSCIQVANNNQRHIETEYYIEGNEWSQCDKIGTITIYYDRNRTYSSVIIMSGGREDKKKKKNKNTHENYMKYVLKRQQ